VACVTSLILTQSETKICKQNIAISWPISCEYRGLVFEVNTKMYGCTQGSIEKCDVILMYVKGFSVSWYTHLLASPVVLIILAVNTSEDPVSTIPKSCRDKNW
jgi:hypothetical protein